MKNILLAQLGSFGDCLYATAIARQIKSDYPDCKLTWAIGAKYQSVIQHNPFVDKIWVIENSDYYFEGWYKFENECNKLRNQGVFDIIFFSQIYPKNLDIFDGTIRSSILRAYPKTVKNVEPVLKLTNEEIQNVENFFHLNNLHGKRIIVFEFAPSSRQSFVNKDFALTSSKIITNKFPDNVAVILSSHLKIDSGIKNVIDGSSLSFRENAELLNRADLLIGCSSGLTWLSTANCVKKIPTIQLINHKAYWFAGVIYDFDYHGLDHSHILELKKCSPNHLSDCVIDVLSGDFLTSKLKYNQIIKPKFFFSFRRLQYNFLINFQFGKIKSLYKSHKQRHGFKIIFVLHTLLNIILFPFAPLVYLRKFISKIRRQ